MERGPLALFGTILAVGVGPALWLGAQLGHADLAPGQRPGPVDEQFPGVDMDFGGAGAGELSGDGEPFPAYSQGSLAPTASPSHVPRPRSSTSATAIPLPVVTVPPSPPRPDPSPSAEPSASAAEPSPSVSLSLSLSPSPSVSAEAPEPEVSPSLEPVQ